MPAATYDTTVGGATANGYAPATEYKTYWGSRLFNTLPLTQTDANIEIALEWACLLLSDCFRWNGTATSDTQILPFPRSGLLTLTGRTLDPNTNPAQLKNAQCEWAGILFSGDRTADDPDSKVLGGEQALIGLTAGPVSLQFEGTRFSSMESFDAYIRSLGQAFAYLSRAVPDSVRLCLVPGWYREAQLKRKVLFGAF